MFSFISRLFIKNKNKNKSYELVETKIEKRQESDSNMFRYYKEELYKDNNDNKGNKKITFSTIAVPSHVDFEEASLKSKSFNLDNNNISYSNHMDLLSKADGTRTGVYNWNFDDWSHKTEAITYSHVFKERKLLSDIYPEKFKQNTPNNSNIDHDSNNGILLKEEGLALKEPELVIMLGPPSDEKQKIMYEEYQESRRDGRIKECQDWEKFEKHMMDFLFTRKDKFPSPIEEMFFRLLNVPTKIESYNFGIGFHKGQWVAYAIIPASSVLFAFNPNMQWPPNAEIIKTTESLIGHILNRDWIFVFSKIPQ